MWEVNLVCVLTNINVDIFWCPEKCYREFDLAHFLPRIYMTRSVSSLMPLKIFFLTLNLLFVFLFMSLLLSWLVYNHYNPNKIPFFNVSLA